MYITFMQISQMIAGVVITVCGFIYARDPECAVVPKVRYEIYLDRSGSTQTPHPSPTHPTPTVTQVLWVQGVIYGSYLYLFLEFLVKRFFAKDKGKGGSKKGAAPAAAVANGNGHAKKSQ